MSSLIPLDYDAHKHLRVKIEKPFNVAKDHHLIPVFAGEFVLAGAEFPLIFVKDNETGQVRSAALAGLRPQENLFINQDGWLAKYIPVSARPTPFVLLPSSNDKEKLVVCVDKQSSFLNEKDGDRLFNDEGEQSDYLKAQTELALEARMQAEQTERFIQKLLSLELIKSNPITVQPKGESPYELKGIYIVDEPRLGELSEADFNELRQLGYLPPIYAALASLFRLDQLLNMRTELRG